MAESNPSDSLCAICDQPGINACAGCHSIRYCSKLCQKTDWPLHKLLCKTYADFSDTSRPPDIYNLATYPPEIYHLYRRAIYFPESGDRPRFIWMHYHGPDAEGRVIVDMHYVNPELEDLQSVNELIENMVLHRNLNRCISIGARAWPLAKEDVSHAGKENQSLLKIDKELSQWIHGPFIAMGLNGPFTLDGEPKKGPWHEQVYDLEPIDLRHIVDRMRGEYFRSGMEFKIYEEGCQEKVKGVRIESVGDRNICCRPAYTSVDAVKSLCSEETDLVTPLADKIGVPLVLRKLPHSLAWRGRHVLGSPCATNHAPGVLDIQKQLDYLRSLPPLPDNQVRDMWEEIDKVSGNVGSYVAVRKDGQLLEPMFMQGLEIYGKVKIREAILGPNKSGMWVKDILAEVSKEEWLEFWETFKDKDPTKYHVF
jgi:hypothetical protein